MQIPDHWTVLAEGKHSRVYDCGQVDWVFKLALNQDQQWVIEALTKITPFVPQGVCVPDIYPVHGGYFQKRVIGHHPSSEYAMKIAYLINQKAIHNYLYFTDIIPDNIIISGRSYLIDVGLRRL